MKEKSYKMLTFITLDSIACIGFFHPLGGTCKSTRLTRSTLFETI